MHVIHLTSGSDAGGVSGYLLSLGEALAERGCRVTFAGAKGVWHRRFEGGPWEWIEAPLNGGMVSLWRAAGQLATTLRGNRPDVIHVHYRKAALVGRMLQRRLGGEQVPLLYTLHLTEMPMGWPWRWLTDFGDHCHAPSVAAKRWLMEVGRVGEERITLIPHGVRVEKWPAGSAADRETARQGLGVPAGRLVGAYVGRLEDPKNEDWVLELAAECRRSGMEASWLMAGDGPNRGKMERRIADLGLQEHVKLLGDCDPLRVYHAADLLVLPSSREGFSYACAEAMCCGVPVLRTRTAGTEEMIVEGVTGRSCAIEKGAFIGAGVAMLRDAAALRTMGRAAGEYVRRELTFERQITETMRLYERLIAR